MSYSEKVMTDEQKFHFDLKGWLALPGVLKQDEIEATKEHLYTLRDRPESLPEHERNSYSGGCSPLLDHPDIVPTLQEIIAPNKMVRNAKVEDESEFEAYGFRCDSSYYRIMPPGTPAPGGPHNGAVEIFPTHQYSVLNGSISAPVCRVAWELNPVEKGKGGTWFLSGSHKSNFRIPEAHMNAPDSLYESYECPAGSAVVFSEAVCHSSADWHHDHDRIVIFNHYLHIAMKWHEGGPSHETVMAMPPQRRTLFRAAWVGGSLNDANREYSEENRAI